MSLPLAFLGGRHLRAPDLARLRLDRVLLPHGEPAGSGPAAPAISQTR
ncbi:hypothetical protein [Actinacidiphila oryziradicis]|nr:hypothetical protein [Actinacidiphila oryziradicis]